MWIEEFANPEYLLLLLGIPALIAWYIYRKKRQTPELRISSTEAFVNIRKTFRQKMRTSLFILRLLAIALTIIALARPRSSSSQHEYNVEGIDIVMAMDVSGSMLAQDFRPDRLSVAKDVGVEFVGNRPNDRIGLVIFSGESFTQCPLTTDHVVLKNLLFQLKTGMMEDGTAIGDGLATAVNRLKNSDAVSKVIILLTDGVNNSGSIDPATAAEIAKIFGIRVYTIGVGTEGMAKMPVGRYPNGQLVYDMAPVKIDEKLLNKISETTNGKYFRATSKTKLQNIYKEIDQLEKSKITGSEYHRKHELFIPFVLLATLLIACEIILRLTIFRSIP